MDNTFYIFVYKYFEHILQSLCENIVIWGLIKKFCKSDKKIHSSAQQQHTHSVFAEKGSWWCAGGIKCYLPHLKQDNFMKNI